MHIVLGDFIVKIFVLLMYRQLGGKALRVSHSKVSASLVPEGQIPIVLKMDEADPNTSDFLKKAEATMSEARTTGQLQAKFENINLKAPKDLRKVWHPLWTTDMIIGCQKDDDQ